MAVEMPLILLCNNREIYCQYNCKSCVKPRPDGYGLCNVEKQQLSFLNTSWRVQGNKTSKTQQDLRLN